MGFWDFWHQHYFLAWCALWLVWGVIWLATIMLRLCSRLLRTIMVSIRGWPPEHLDANGDWKPERKEES